MGKKGFSLVELLVAIVISVIIVAALTSLFIVGNRTFRTNKQVSDITDDVRNAITTLDFVFSRWGTGVPCPQSGCSLQTPPPDCVGYPPTDPMCLTINGPDVVFYANLYGIGFVQIIDTNSNTANIVSCRLNGNGNQNCYYIWNAGTLKGGFTNGTPRYYSFQTFTGSPDCISSPNANLSVSRSLTEQSNQNPSALNLDTGDYISRVPHRVRLYLSNGFLFMDRVDMANICNDNENAIRLARASAFSAQKVGRSVRVDITFVGEDGRTFPITRYYGR